MAQVKLYLGQMTVDIKTEQSVPTSDFINVNVDAVAKVRISPHAEGIKLAAKNFLNKRPEEITRDLQDFLQGNICSLSMALTTLTKKPASFSARAMGRQNIPVCSRGHPKVCVKFLCGVE